MEKNKRAKNFRMLSGQATYAGEGELHALLRMSGMSEADFSQLAGIHVSVVRRWYGHPLFAWPVELLRHVLWARNMAKALSARGYVPESFKPKLAERQMPTGRYPRKAGDWKEPNMRPDLPRNEAKDYSPWRALGKK